VYNFIYEGASMGLEYHDCFSVENPAKVLWISQIAPDAIEREARLLRTLKLYKSGKLSSWPVAWISGALGVCFRQNEKVLLRLSKRCFLA
jgi:hypothetical protein